MRRIWKPAAALFFLLVLFIYFNNSTAFIPASQGSPIIVAHRGMGQRYNVPIESGGCIAVHMKPPVHDYLENTIPSIRAAFDHGAGIVEFDIRVTADRRFAVFHDRTLECKTNGSGPVRARTMEELKSLDVGYGYTFDGGRTFPFRGKAVGAMPSMEEVLSTFPEESFLLDIKDNEPADAELLADHLAKLPPEQLSRLIIFARDGTIVLLRRKFPNVRMLSANSVAGCLLRYIAYGWTGIVPSSCARSALFIPVNVTPWLWGWPGKFMSRIGSHGSLSIVMGPFPSREISPGLDTREMLDRLPAGFTGGIWTNEVDLAAGAR